MYLRIELMIVKSISRVWIVFGFNCICSYVLAWLIFIPTVII